MIRRILKAPEIAWRKILSLRGFPVVEANASEIVSRLGKKFSSHQLLAIFEAGGPQKAADFYRGYIREMHEMQSGKWMEKMGVAGKNIHFWNTPWGGCQKEYSANHLSEQYSRRYVEKMLKVRDSIEKNGYDFKKYGHITGQLLTGQSGQRRFVVWSGHRRAFSLINLGYEKIPIELSGGDRWNGSLQDHRIDIRDLKNWPNVKNGLYSEKEALDFFNAFFNQPH